MAFRPIQWFLLAGGSLVFLGLLDGREDGLLRPDDPQIVATGQRVYTETCASCHGANLEGEAEWQSPNPDGTMPAPPHDVTGHTWHHDSQLLFEMTKNGVAEAAGLDDYASNMPAYRGVLTDDEIVAVLSFIKSTWPPEVRTRHDDLDAAMAR